jgi:hypothetical protein
VQNYDNNYSTHLLDIGCYCLCSGKHPDTPSNTEGEEKPKMLSPIIGLALPAIAPLAIIGKLPKPAKKVFFKIPAWLSSTALALGTAHLLHFTGVLAPYAIIFIDLVLFPSILLMSWWFQKRNKEKCLQH